MIEVIRFRLECEHHFWNFPSLEEARSAVRDYEETESGFLCKKVVEVYDEFGRLLESKEQELC